MNIDMLAQEYYIYNVTNSRLRRVIMSFVAAEYLTSHFFKIIYNI
jgi:hypothetical protein